MSGERRLGPRQRQLTLRLQIESTRPSLKVETIRQLAAAKATTVESLRGEDGLPKAYWLVFEDGFFENSPLRLEVLATASGLDTSLKAAAVADSDVVLLVINCADLDLVGSPGQPVSIPLWQSSLDHSKVVVLAQQEPDKAQPADNHVLQTINAPDHTPVVAIAPSGEGIRYALAVAVRQTLDQVREADSNGRHRRLPVTSTEILDTLSPQVANDRTGYQRPPPETTERLRPPHPPPTARTRQPPVTDTAPAQQTAPSQPLAPITPHTLARSIELLNEDPHQPQSTRPVPTANPAEYHFPTHPYQNRHPTGFTTGGRAARERERARHRARRNAVLAWALLVGLLLTVIATVIQERL